MSTCPFRVDLTDPEVQESWYPTYDAMRSEAPVYFDEPTGHYILTRYEDVKKVLGDPKTFPNHWSAAKDFKLIESGRAREIYTATGWERYTPLSSNPPMHRPYRRNVDKWFNGSGAKLAEPMIRAIVNDLIDDWIDNGQVEFISQFAEPLPLRVISALMGFPDEDIPQLKKWSEYWVQPFARGLSEEAESEVARQGVAFQHYIHKHIQQRRENPGEDFLSFLVHTTFDDPAGPRPFTDGEIINSVDHLFIGGNETTTFALASAFWLMLGKPGTQERVRSDRSLIPALVSESMRLESPTQGLWRGVAENVTIGGVDIPAGATIHLRYAAANRDPEKYPDPDELDLDRKNTTSHLAFAAGIHRCPGEGLSKLEQDIALNVLFDRISKFRLTPGANDFTHLPGFVLRALKELHMDFDRDEAECDPAALSGDRSGTEVSV